MEMLNCGRNKAVNCLKELDQEKGIGLIEKRRIGLGKTNVIYVKNFSLTEYPDEPAIFDSEETPENVAERKENTEKTIEEEVENKNDEWYLEIPCINLKANIKEGTTKDIMEDYIGHFEETKKDIGNIGLAAHNRGYKNNYFQNLKELKQNDEIYYKYKNEKRKYVVIKNIIIKDTDWTNLEESDGNIITLITCVENQPEYRRCVQGKEKIEEREDF